MIEPTLFEETLRILDLHIQEARNRTDKEHIERFEFFGFAEEDYRETAGITNDFFSLWWAPEIAKEKGMKPQEYIAKIMLTKLGKMS